MNAFLLNIAHPDYKEVEQYALNSLAIKPDAYLLLEKLAWLYQRMSKMEEAIQICQRMIELRPDLPNGYNTIGTTYMKLRKFDEGEKWSLKALEIDSSTLDWTVYNLAMSNQMQRQYEDLFRLVDRFERRENAISLLIYSFCAAANQVGAMRYARAIFNYSTKMYGGDYPDAIATDIISEGLFQLRSGNSEQADSCFQVALQTYAGIHYLLIDAYLGKAQAAALQHRTDSAEFYFKRAIDYYPDLFRSWGRELYASSYYHYARFLLTQHRFADAEVQLLKAEEIDPRNPLNYYGMAVLHAAQKQDREALVWLAKALEWYYPDYDAIMAEPLFKKIRKKKQFKSLMDLHFPNGSDRPKVEALARQYMPEIFGDH